MIVHRSVYICILPFGLYHLNSTENGRF